MTAKNLEILLVRLAKKFNSIVCMCVFSCFCFCLKQNKPPVNTWKFWKSFITFNSTQNTFNKPLLCTQTKWPVGNLKMNPEILVLKKFTIKAGRQTQVVMARKKKCNTLKGALILKVIFTFGVFSSLRLESDEYMWGSVLCGSLPLLIYFDWFICCHESCNTLKSVIIKNIFLMKLLNKICFSDQYGLLNEYYLSFDITYRSGYTISL